MPWSRTITVFSFADSRSGTTDTTKFRSMYFAFIDEDHREPTAYKLIVVGEEEKIVGVHIVGQGSDEAMQGFGVAVKMGGESTTCSRSISTKGAPALRRPQHARRTLTILWRFTQRKWPIPRWQSVADDGPHLFEPTQVCRRYDRPLFLGTIVPYSFYLSICSELVTLR
jgi:Pyridine nucleotide-disulphide oxidoreductase, dimerisation domain